jgi:hypothetical protein
MVCYGLLGRTKTDPASSYCYAPNGGAIPELAGGHFKPSAIGEYIGTPDVQFYGVASDSVRSLRLEVGGAWRSVPISRNGFYLDLAGVALEDLGIAEGTLVDGTVQRYNMRTGSYE